MVAAGSVFLVFMHLMIFKAKQIWASLMLEYIKKKWILLIVQAAASYFLQCISMYSFVIFREQCFAQWYLI